MRCQGRMGTGWGIAQVVGAPSFLNGPKPYHHFMILTLSQTQRVN